MTFRKRVASTVFVFCAAASSIGASIAVADIFGTGANQFAIDFASIPSATNPTTGIPAGDGFTFTGVPYDYRIGLYEITNDQWTKFKAELGTAVTGNPAGAYDQDPTFPDANLPTNRVSWYEIAQFVNWLNTSSGHQAAYKFTGTQGQSDYSLGVWSTEEAANGTNLYRHKDAFYFLPTEDEWVKAGYWNGTELQTYSNASAGDLLSGEPDPARWRYGASGISEPWTVDRGAAELNGTYNMMGNISEWLESPGTVGSYSPTADRAVRGGAFGLTADKLASSHRLPNGIGYEDSDIGFRVGSKLVVTPEPGGASLLLVGILGLLFRCRRNTASRPASPRLAHD